VPHDQSTQLVSFSVDQADVLGSSPTGLTLNFSSPINLSNLFLPDAQQNALEVVNASGQVWPSTAEQYQVNNASLNLIFDEPLPAGQYSLIVPPQGGLTDLAGQPVTASGEPPGVLAQWTVAPGAGSYVQNNLGVLWPSNAQWKLDDQTPFSQTTVIAPHKNVSFRWVVDVPGLFIIQTQSNSGSLAIQISGNTGTTVLDPDSTSKLSTYEIALGDGVYELRFTNLGSQTVSFSWVLKFGLVDWEKIVDNGVGQASALSLMAFTPGPADSVTNSVSNVGGISQFPESGVFAGSMGPVPLSLLVTVNTGPLGQPSLDGGLSQTGPGQTGVVTVADRQPGLFSGFHAGALIATAEGESIADTSVEAETTVAKAVLNDEATRTSSFRLGLGSGPEADRAGADLSALAGDDWLVRLVSGAKSRWVRLAYGSEITAQPAQASEALAIIGSEPTSVPSDATDSKRAERSRSIVKADIASAVGLVVVVAMVRLSWKPLRAKWNRRHLSAARAQQPGRPFIRAPHALTGNRSPARYRMGRLLRR
jgi:hypothetical protein